MLAYSGAADLVCPAHYLQRSPHCTLLSNKKKRAERKWGRDSEMFDVFQTEDSRWVCSVGTCVCRESGLSSTQPGAERLIMNCLY